MTIAGATRGLVQIKSISVIAIVGSVRTTEMRQAKVTLNGRHTAETEAKTAASTKDMANDMAVAPTVLPRAT